MTPEMIELEFAHINLDKKLKNGNAEQFEDPDYEDYDEESDIRDQRLSDSTLPTVRCQDEDGWEDVETDDPE